MSRHADALVAAQEHTDDAVAVGDHVIRAWGLREFPGGFPKIRGTLQGDVGVIWGFMRV